MNYFPALTLLFILLDFTLTFAEDPDIGKRTPEFITSYGYPLENHTITTEDGYILTYFRIPSGKNSTAAPNSNGTKPVILLQHGLLATSACWFIQPEQNMLPFKLADEGYDVWLGNNRGTTYSQGHTNSEVYNSSQPVNIYWSFSWEQMGLYDTPAAIDYITQLTGQESIFYLGHSQGTTQMFVMLSLRPEYNAKIKLGVAYSPVVYLGNVKGPISLLGPVAGLASITSVGGILTSKIGAGEFLPDEFVKYSNKFLPQVCREPVVQYTLCANVAFLFAGYDYNQTNFDRLPVALSQIPDTTSVMSLIHYGQEINSHKFAKFDYGLLLNPQEYRRLTPPEIELSPISAPIALYYGKNDWLAMPQDVIPFRDSLPNVVVDKVVDWADWNHLDPIFGINATEFLYNPTIELLKTYV